MSPHSLNTPISTVPTPHTQKILVSASDSTSFLTVSCAIQDEVKKLPALRKLSYQKNRLFSIDVSLIGLSVR